MDCFVTIGISAATVTNASFEGQRCIWLASLKRDVGRFPETTSTAGIMNYFEQKLRHVGMV